MMELGTQSRWLVLSAANLNTWLASMRPGDILQYYRGFLALDREPLRSRLSNRDRVALVRIAELALSAQNESLVDLVQKRNGPCDYSYLMIARRRAGGAVIKRKQDRTAVAGGMP
jgi:hypothetical protein